VKGDGINEEFLKRTFQKNVTNASVVSVEMKNKYVLCVIQAVGYPVESFVFFEAMRL
jgi:hypothetical protein